MNEGLTRTAAAALAAADHPAADRPPAPAVGPLLVGRRDAARLCGLSPATWSRLDAAGRIPAALRLGGRVLWRVAELRDWCAAGCPDRRTWEAMRDAARRNGRGV